MKSNPFSTQFTRPGAIPFLLIDDAATQSIINKFKAANWMAQIAGPHGSGKTTLVRHLEPQLRIYFDRIKYVAIQKIATGMRIQASMRYQTSEPRRDDRCLLVVDGIERLSRLNRWLLKQSCRRRKIGMLATVHHARRGLPTIATLKPSLSTFLHVCEWLQRETTAKIPGDVCAMAFESNNQNFREAFMTLYDKYEIMKTSQRKRESAII